MKKKAEEQQGNVANGHGTLTKINDQQEFFAAAKKSNRLICIFTRNSNKMVQENKESKASKTAEIAGAESEIKSLSVA